MLDDIVECLSSSRGATIIGFEIVAPCQILRVAFDSGVSLELTGGWLYGAGAKIAFGAMDIGFYLGNEEELLAVMEEDERGYQSKLAGLKGLKLLEVAYSDNCLTLNLNKSRQIRWFCLSREQLGIRMLNNTDLRFP